MDIEARGKMRFQREARQRIFLAPFVLIYMFVFLFGISVTACSRLQVCPEPAVMTIKELQNLWNIVSRATSKSRLEHWIPQLLQVLLNDGSYLLEDRGSYYRVVKRNGSEQHRCRVRVYPDLKRIKATNMLSHLHHVVHKHKVSLKGYLYHPPKRFVVYDGSKSKTAVFNCEDRGFLTDYTYWKAISGKHSRDTRDEACKLGTSMKKWEPCFSAKMQNLYKKRMGVYCGR